MSENPYAAPQTQPDPADFSDAEEIRRSHIDAEASIKSIGFLYLLGGLFAAAAGVFLPIEDPDTLIVGILLVALGAFQIWTGIGLRRLKRTVRIPAAILATLGLLGFPIGTLISIYLLYLLFSEKGRFVVSEDYKEIIALTPHIKRKTSIVVWIVLALFLLATAALMWSATNP